jgi:hypothetical protein
LTRLVIDASVLLSASVAAPATPLSQIYMHYPPRADAARRLSAAFGSEAEQMMGETA